MRWKLYSIIRLEVSQGKKWNERRIKKDDIEKLEHFSKNVVIFKTFQKLWNNFKNFEKFVNQSEKKKLWVLLN